MPLDPGFVERPWWWGARDRPDDPPDVGIPSVVDVVVIGGGVTGMEAARALAAGGRDVIVCDSGVPGEGGSTRNAGQIGRNFKTPYTKLKTMLGAPAAKGVFDELQDAYDELAELGERDPARIGWRQCGRVIGAMSPALAQKLQAEYAIRAAELGENVQLLDRDEIRAEMQSDLYHGGVRLPDNGAIQPALYHQALQRRAVEAGAAVLSHTPVIGVARHGDRFEVHTARGTVRTRNVVVATNGYSGAAVPAIRRRVLAITSYMIATERLSTNLVAKALANGRTYHDNRRRSHFFTVADDGRRILMGGRTGTAHRSRPWLYNALAADMAFILPELESAAITHGWSGRCAAPLDLFPRFGVLDGMHYALGYSFSGMAMGPHLARKLATMILAPDVTPKSQFARPAFKAFPAPLRGPWTAGLLTQWYAEADRPAGMKRKI